MSKEVTFHGMLVAKKKDWLDYVTYVFEDLEATDPMRKYVMCVRFPNWAQGPIDIDEEGFVTVRYVTAGEDKWYDGTSYVPYKCTDIHFLKFVPLEQMPEEAAITL